MSARRVLVLGAGAAGEHFVGALRRLDPEAEITIVERHLAGGECSYYACLPTKTLLRPLEVLSAARLAPGAAEAVGGGPDVARVWWWRDQVTDGRDDFWHAGWLAEQRATLVRGEARVARPGAVEVEGRELPYDVLVVATGSSPAVPPIEGIDRVEYWTSRDAVWANAVPESLLVLGGGPVAVELAQCFHRLGSRVTIAERHGHLLSRLDADAGELLQERLEEEGVEVRVGVEAGRVEPRGGGIAAELTSGEILEAERLLLATGRTPNVAGLGLEQLGVELTPAGIRVDERLRAAEGVYAIGDAAGVALLTHAGKYQARVAAANIAGRDARADYRALPAAVFTDPQVASVGRMDGDGVVAARFEIAGGRLSTYERPRRPGVVKLAADGRRRVLVGALAVAPEAGEWLGQLTLAIRAEVSLDVLLDTIQPYPTFSEAIFGALCELEAALQRRVSDAGRRASLG
ncbi:MAG TPA: NAD(P)/FAD-dependent oxidoreductase [Gaiellaceae bacterium]|nr:NAD(P)/FAD-dependent oxidoreductase [Gaiellaceae bacterium]